MTSPAILATFAAVQALLVHYATLAVLTRRAPAAVLDFCARVVGVALSSYTGVTATVTVLPGDDLDAPVDLHVAWDLRGYRNPVALYEQTAPKVAALRGVAANIARQNGDAAGEAFMRLCGLALSDALEHRLAELDGRDREDRAPACVCGEDPVDASGRCAECRDHDALVASLTANDDAAIAALYADEEARPALA